MKLHLLTGVVASIAVSVSVSLLTQASTSASQSTERWRPNPERGTASSTLSGGRRSTQIVAYAIEPTAQSSSLQTLLAQAIWTNDCT
jgi:hypothetical protein